MESVITFLQILKPEDRNWCEHFLSPHLRNWCLKLFRGMLLLLFIIIVVVVVVDDTFSRPFAAKPSRDLLFIRLWAITMKKARRKYQNGQVCQAPIIQE